MNNIVLHRFGRPSLGLGLIVCMVLGLLSVSTHTANRAVTGAGSQKVPGVAAAAGVAAPSVSSVRAAVRVAAQPPGGLVESAKGFGSTEGSFSVSEDGAAKYEVPLWTPDGRGESAPSLALSYDSRVGNGIVGVGWTLKGLPSVRRCPKTLAQDGVTDGVHFGDTDAYCLDGMRMLPSDSWGKVQEFRTEKESFSRLIGHGMTDGVPDYFQLVTKSGATLYLGQDPNAQLRAYELKRAAAGNGLEPASDEPVTLAWAVDRIEDRNGNAATIQYDNSSGSVVNTWAARLLPRSVTYGPNRRVEFTHASRPGSADSFEHGVHLAAPKRLLAISMWGGPIGGQQQLLRRYELTYTNSSISGRGLLSSVKECDPDGACLMPQEFIYSKGGYEFDEIDAGDIELPASRHKLVTGDINGDGRDDLLYTHASGRQWFIRFSTGKGFGEPVNAGIGTIDRFKEPQITTADVDRDGRMDAMVEIVEGGEEKLVFYRSIGSKFARSTEDVDGGAADNLPEPAHFADLDGNGLPDYTSATWGKDGVGPWYYRLNTGTSGANRWANKVTTAMTRPVSSGASVIDINGDGRDEIAGWNYLADQSAGITSFGLSPAGEAETPVVRLFAGQTNPVYADVNGDGLPDAVRPYSTTDPEGGNLTTQLSTGRVFGPHSSEAVGYEAPAPDADGNQATGVRAVDFNGDGADELLVFPKAAEVGDPREIHLWAWKSNKWVREPLNQKAGFGNKLIQPLDIDGNGVMDLVHYTNDDGGELRVLRRTDAKPDLMTSAGVFPNGRRVEFDYSTLADRNVHTPCPVAKYPLTCPVSGGAIVSRHHEAAPEAQDGWATVDHSYNEGRTDLHGRGWLGFAEHTVVDRRTGRRTVTAYDNITSHGGTGENTEVYPFAQLPKTVTMTVPGDDFSKGFRHVISNDWEVRRYPGGGYGTDLRHVTETEHERPVGAEGWPAPFRIRQVASEYDDFGNEEKVKTSVAFGRSTTVETTYEDDTHRRFGRPDTVVTTGCPPGEGDCAQRETAFDYDEAGNVTENITEPNGDDEVYLNTRTDYGDAGEVRKVTVSDKPGEERVETFEYDDDLLLPTAMTNAENHTTTLKNHSGLGVILESTDANGVRTTMTYDKFGRLRGAFHADGDSERIGHLNLFGGQITSTTGADGSGSVIVADQMGREIERRVRAFDGEWSKVFTTYNELGLVASATRPSTEGKSPHKTTFSYDNRGRLTTQKAPDDVATVNSYAGSTTTTRDGVGATTKTIANGDGDVATRIEPGPGSEGELETTYSYGPFGELTKVVAPDGSTQTMRYDAIGQRTWHSDPSAGVTETSHNGFGEVVSETNGADETARFEHDKIGRVTKVTSPDGGETRTWDTADNGVGLPASATSADGVTTRYAYDEFGRTESETWTIDGTPYRIDHGYDEIGRQSRITYPKIPDVADRLEVVYGYNDHGYVSSVTNAADDTLYWQGLDRNADGLLTRERLANGVANDTSYDARTGMLSAIAAYGKGGDLVKMSVDYDPNRNVTMRKNLATGRTENYAYDQLNRLVNWQVSADGQSTSTSYDYDEVGNLETETIAGQPDRDVTYRYGQEGAPKHALTSRNTDTYRYDDAGRQISGAGRNVDYNRFNLPTSLTWGAQPQRTTEYSYDADGARVRKHDAGPDGQTVTYVPELFERRVRAGTGNTEIHNLHNIIVEGRPVLQLNRVQKAEGGPVIATKPRYLHTDNQGSVLAVTNKAGQRVGAEEDGFLDQLLYDPFGRRIDAENNPLGEQRRGGPRQGYITLEHEDENSHINMNGRIYDAAARRFLTPDPRVSDPLNSQDLNRYSYAWNNPATVTDPSGYQECRWDDESNCPDGSIVIVGNPITPPPAFDIVDWYRGWDRATGRGGTARRYIESVGGPDPRLDPLGYQQFQANEFAKEQIKELMKLDAEDLAWVLAKLDKKVKAGDVPCAATSGSECFLNKALRDSVRKLTDYRNQVVLEDNGGKFNVTTRYDQQLRTDAGNALGGAAALTGGLLSNLIYAATGDAELAKLVRGLGGLAGSAAKARNNWNAFHADPERNPLPRDHFSPVPGD
jgi:RHS repeat-associated protein